MQYEHVDDAEIIANLNARMANLEREHLGHELNLLAVRTLPEGDESRAQAEQQALEAQAVIDAAWTAAKTERDARQATLASEG